MADWMSTLPAEKRKIPLNQLYLPGSHDSFSCTLNANSRISDSAPKIVQILAKILPIQPIVYIWSLTQRQQPTQQLSLGIRYFDVRVAVDSQDLDQIHTVHGLYGGRIKEILGKISAFLIAHPTEVVLLDFNHFYDFTDMTHKKLLDFLDSLFGSKLCPQLPYDQVTLHFMHSKGYQVIVFYQDSTPLAKSHPVWSSSDISSPWADTDKIDKLLPFLKNALDNRNPKQFFITQGILTPQSSTVLAGPCKGLEPLGTLATKTVVQWVKENFSIFKANLNIVMCDFISKEDFCNTVIGFNFQ